MLPAVKTGNRYVRDMTPPALMLLCALALALLANVLLARSSLWYWFPVQYEDCQKLYVLATEKQPYDVVVIGSSVSQRGVISKVMENELNRVLPRSRPWRVYNASISGGTFPSFVQVCRSLLDRKPRPRLVVLMLTTLNFNARADMNLNVKHFTTAPGDYWTLLLHAGRNDQRWSATSGLLHGVQVVLQAPLLYRRGHLVRQFREEHGSSYIYPFTDEAIRKNNKELPGATRPIQDLKKERVDTLQEKFVCNFSISPLISGWLEQVADELAEKDIGLVLALAPESDWLIANAYHGERERSARFLAEFANARKIPWQDLARPPYRFLDKDYFDGCDHLDPWAAERLSRDLVTNLVAPALREKP